MLKYFFLSFFKGTDYDVIWRSIYLQDALYRPQYNSNIFFLFRRHIVSYVKKNLCNTWNRRGYCFKHSLNSLRNSHGKIYLLTWQGDFFVTATRQTKQKLYSFCNVYTTYRKLDIGGQNTVAVVQVLRRICTTERVLPLAG
jgi:hypothetical protein